MRAGEKRFVTRHCVTASLRLAIAAAVLLLASGCTNLGYYWQSVNGQLDVWRRERPIEEVIADPSTARALKSRLARVLEIRAFASRELGLPDNQSYRRYADLGRPFVVWNVFAAPEFSVQPEQWCFVFAGCVSYRGYFAREDAERFAAGLAAEGYDVFVGGVPAYSTLGWFADPVLNTVISYSGPRLARLLFHELSHQVVYVRGDTVFNESFAVAVEKEGVRRWLASRGSPQDKAGYEAAVARQADFLQLAGTYQAKLASLYRSRMAPGAMRARKKELFGEMEREYRGLKDRWGGFAGYDRWFAQKPNNALLASVGIYSQLVPAFEALLEREGRDLPRFYAAVRELAALPKEEREARMRALTPPVMSDK
ncbi:MAG TPA: aminopeptidase [Burkholderiales bacterium]|nr:aminopeptidase [Burkholderiales bacterium]